MSGVTREAVYAAVFARAAAVPGLVTASRKARHWADVTPAEQPALFQIQRQESVEAVTGLPLKRRFGVDLYLYAHSGDPAVAPASLLNPLLYAGSFTIGAISGLFGDKWNLGFLAETEKQVEGHLDSHLARLPEDDRKSRAIVAQMKEDEAEHARTALIHGGAELPAAARQAMRAASRLMTGSTYWI